MNFLRGLKFLKFFKSLKMDAVDDYVYSQPVSRRKDPEPDLEKKYVGYAIQHKQETVCGTIAKQCGSYYPGFAHPFNKIFYDTAEGCVANDTESFFEKGEVKDMSRVIRITIEEVPFEGELLDLKNKTFAELKAKYPSENE